MAMVSKKGSKLVKVHREQAERKKVSAQFKNPIIFYFGSFILQLMTVKKYIVLFLYV